MAGNPSKLRINITLAFTLLIRVCTAQQSDAIHYTSLNTSIYLGAYDGTLTAKQVRSYGNFGLGSEERLVGELVLLDGVMYTIPSSGKAKIINPDAKIPFAAVKTFRAEKTVSVKRNFATLKQFEMHLDSIIDKNRFAAIRISATFSSIKFRSFYEQQKPYSDLKNATAAMFEKDNFTGTMVGFFTPKSAEALNSPVYHFHVIDQAKTTGGHLLEGSITEAKIEIDYADQLIVDLPKPETEQDIDLNKKVEKDN